MAQSRHGGRFGSGRGGAPWWTLALLLPACGGSPSADFGSGSGYEYAGGQTGSLLPPEQSCGPALGQDRVLTLAGAEAVFVGRVEADAGVTTDWTLTDSDGETVPIEQASRLEHALQPSSDLEPGRYVLGYSCEGRVRTAEVVVLDPVPAQTALVLDAALLYDPSAYSCASIDDRATLRLTFSDQASALVDTAQLTLWSADFELLVAPWASLDVSRPTFDLGVPICSDSTEKGCLPRRYHELELVTERLDGEGEWGSIALVIDAACVDGRADAGSVEPHVAEPEPTCALARRRDGRLPSALLVGLALLACACRRRSLHAR